MNKAPHMIRRRPRTTIPPTKPEMVFVYVLGSRRQNDRRTYVGWTNDLTRRLQQHNAGVGAKSTRGRKWVLLYSETCKTRQSQSCLLAKNRFTVNGLTIVHGRQSSPVCWQRDDSAVLIPCGSQLIFAHDAFVRLVDALYAILKLAVMLWQLLGDDERTSQEVAVKRGIEKNDLANMEFVVRHGSPPGEKPIQVSYTVGGVGEIRKFNKQARHARALKPSAFTGSDFGRCLFAPSD